MLEDTILKFTDSGIIVPTTEEIINELEIVFKNIFGNDLDVRSTSSAGQLITSLASLIDTANGAMLYLANQFNPETSSGQFQDAIASIYFLQRRKSSPTVVNVKISGYPGTQIDTTFMLKDVNNETYISLSDTVIPVEGETVIQVKNVKDGPIVCNAYAIDTLNNRGSIITSITGIESAVNETAGIIGSDLESQQEFEDRRYNTVQINSLSMDGSIYSHIREVPDVISIKLLDNRGDDATTKQGVYLKPHSIFACVAGGTDHDVATAIYNSISCGCDMNGDISEVITDPISGAMQTITFARPINIPVYIRVTANIISDTPSTVIELAKENIINDFNGKTTGKHIGIGETIYAMRFSSACFKAGLLGLKNIEISRNNVDWLPFITFNGDELPVIEENNINIILEVE